MPIMLGTTPLALAVGGDAVARAYLGSTLVYEAAPAGRVPIADTDTILFAGHSFVQTAYGMPVGEEAEPFGGVLQTDWLGTTLSDYAGYASMATIRALDGHLLNDSWDAAIIAEFTNPFGPGFADFDSEQGRETLQNAYWDAMDAQRAGGELIIQDIWPPQGRYDLYANATGFSQGLREWLEAHTGRPVWIIPAFPFVEAMRAEYGDAIYGDGLHLVRGNSPYPRGMSYLVYSFLTQQRCPFVRTGDEAIDQMAWDTLLAYECAGMGGSIRYTSTLPATDPLPSPEPLPGQHPLQAYYDSATILIHHSTDGAAPAGGPVTALANQGGAGAMFDATVSGSAIPLSGRYLEMSASAGMPTMAAPADLIGVRLMWVMQIGTYVNGTRVFGGAVSSPYGFEVRINSNASGQLAQLWSNASGTGASVNLGTRATWPTTPMLVEVEVSASAATIYINGVSSGSGSHAWAQFLVENLGKGQVSGAVPLEGLMGDVLGVVTGRGDTVAAVAAARAYLDDRFALGLA